MIDEKPVQKPVLAKLTASMTREQKLDSLTVALENSGFKVLPGRRQTQA
jgi:hypothetical protein